MFEKEVKLFMLFDILGDMVRSGMIQWKVDRERLEDVKDHIMDLILITKILAPHFPSYVDINKMIDYIIVHDLPEAITGDISDVSSTDVAYLATKLMEYQTIYSMSLSVGAKILPGSLADYLN